MGARTETARDEGTERMSDDIGELAEWIGKSEDAYDECAVMLVRRVAALLNRDPYDFREGDPLPNGWQMCLFTSLTLTRELKGDGHAAVDTLMPPAPLPRRMLGGRRLYYHAPVVIGDRLRRVSEVTAITPKEGRSGKLVIVTLRHSIYREGADTPAIVEEQDTIYREEAASGAAKKGPRAGVQPPGEPDFFDDIVTEPQQLFRYSAICFNTHRIHYDQAYTTETEGYPGLIVNGGLTALLLVDLLDRKLDQQPKRFEARTTGAIICGRPIRLCGMNTESGWTLWVQDENANVLLEVKAT
jgi:3-methylfumaryl-CoA hydratase